MHFCRYHFYLVTLKEFEAKEIFGEVIKINNDKW